MLVHSFTDAKGLILRSTFANEHRSAEVRQGLEEKQSNRFFLRLGPASLFWCLDELDSEQSITHSASFATLSIKSMAWRSVTGCPANRMHQQSVR